MTSTYRDFKSTMIRLFSHALRSFQQLCLTITRLVSATYHDVKPKVIHLLGHSLQFLKQLFWTIVTRVSATYHDVKPKVIHLLGRTWQSLKQLFWTIVTHVSATYRAVKPKVIHLLGRTWQSLKQLFWTIVTHISATYRAVKPKVIHLLGRTWQSLKQLFWTIVTHVSATYRDVKPKVIHLLGRTWQSLKQLFWTIVTHVSATYRDVKPKVIHLLGQTWQSLKQLFWTIVTLIIATYRAVKSKIFSLFASSSKGGPSAFLLFVFFVLVLIVIGSFGILGIWTYYAHDLPEHETLANYNPATTTRFYAGDGRLLAEFATTRRTFVPIEAIPKRVQEAFIAVEDQRFFTHFGLDMIAIMRALVKNVYNIASGRRLVGASTITQQVAKNMLLFSNEQSLTRKIREAILAVRVERALSKNRILELYLNEIYLGLHSYGIAAAALNYFNKGLDEVTLAEIAYLAALPKAPANYHPSRHTNAAIARRNLVLDRMVAENYITSLQAQQAKQQDLILYQRDETEIVRADYFTAEVRRQVIERFTQQLSQLSEPLPQLIEQFTQQLSQLSEPPTQQQHRQITTQRMYQLIERFTQQLSQLSEPPTQQEHRQITTQRMYQLIERFTQQLSQLSEPLPQLIEQFTQELSQLIRQIATERMYQGGLAIRTTIDPQLQDIAITALRHSLLNYDRRHGLRDTSITHFGFENWANRLASLDTTSPLLPGWHYAIIDEITEQEDVLILFADRRQGQIPAAQLQWIKIQPEDTQTPITTVADILSPGDLVIVEAIDDDTTDNTADNDTFTLRQWPEVQGAVVALDPHTGRILAMVGGFSFERSQFNRATQAERQPGSAFKPFVALTALENGFTPASIIMDAPFEAELGEDQPIWRPLNYSRTFFGPTPLRIGIERSRNLMTIRLALATGLQTIRQTSQRFGIYDHVRPHLSLALGASETTLLRLTTAYAMIVNGGYQIEPTLIDRIQSRQGETLYQHDNRPCEACQNVTWSPGLHPPDIPDVRNQIVQSPIAFQVLSILEGVVQRGTARRLRSLQRPLAGKTGTTNDNRDAWFIGLTPDLVVGTYVGFDQPRSLGARETGSSAALPIVKQVFQEWLVNKPAIPFRMPSGIRLIRINRQTGLPPNPGETDVIWEAFLPGTEPTSDIPLSDPTLRSEHTTEDLQPTTADDLLNEALDGIY